MKPLFRHQVTGVPAAIRRREAERILAEARAKGPVFTGKPCPCDECSWARRFNRADEEDE